MNPCWKRCAWAPALLLLLTAAATAGPLDDARAARERGDHAVARQLLQPLVDQGQAEALHWMSVMLVNGEGGPADAPGALRLAQRAAEGGHAAAQRNVGRAYLHGQGVERNAALGVQWLRRAADQGDRQAQFMLGWAYKFGRGIERDLALGLQWTTRAAEQGDADAQDELGLALMIGEGAPEDPAAAHRWFRAAAAQGHARGLLHVGMGYFYGMGVAQDRTEAASWVRRAAEAGSASAMKFWSGMLDNGHGVARDRAAAADWLRRAAEAGDGDAQVQMAARAMAGEGQAPDTKAALPWARRAAEQGHPQGQMGLGLLLAEQDPVQAHAWLWLAAERRAVGAGPMLAELRRSFDAARLAQARQVLQQTRGQLAAAGVDLPPPRERDLALVGAWQGTARIDGGPLRRWQQTRDEDGRFELHLSVGDPPAAPELSVITGFWWTHQGLWFALFDSEPEQPRAYRYAPAASGCLEMDMLDPQTLKPILPRYRFEDCRIPGAAPPAR